MEGYICNINSVIVYAFFLEPLIFGHSMNEFTTIECIIHWLLTIITWITVAFLILRDARKKLNFQLKGTYEKWNVPAIVASCILVGLMMVINFVDIGKLKIVQTYELATLIPKNINNNFITSPYFPCKLTLA